MPHANSCIITGETAVVHRTKDTSVPCSEGGKNFHVTTDPQESKKSQ